MVCLSITSLMFVLDGANHLGCMIVELLDYRPTKAKDPVLANPEHSRVVLTPNPETLWADICLLNQKAGSVWTDQDALEVEARILVCYDVLQKRT